MRQSVSLFSLNQMMASRRPNLVELSMSRIHAALSPPCSVEATSAIHTG